MRHRNPIDLMVVLAGLLVLALFGTAWSEEGKDQSMFPGLHSEVQVTGIGYAGPANTAKWEEYRDLSSSPIVADWIDMDWENEDKSYDMGLQVKRAGLDDMNLVFTGEDYGKWKFEFEFNRIPHNFISDVGTIFGGIGTTEMRISDSIQAAAQGALSDPAMVAFIDNSLHVGFNEGTIGLRRDQTRLSFSFIQLDPFSAGIDLNHEERTGGRPIGGGFGFSNALGLVEPIDYGTTDAMIWAAYDKDWLHLKAFYGFNYFENRDGSLSFDNPFRNVDSTAAFAYAQSRQNGPREGKMALCPDNLEHRTGLELGIDAPAKTRITSSFTATWREDDPGLHAYTTNTAITTGAVSGVAGILVPFDATKKENLPQRGFDGSVNTQRFTLGITNRAIQNLEVRAKYRMYNFDNSSDEIEFPGYARVDAVWEPEEIENQIWEWTRHEGGLEFSYSLPCDTTATLGYRFVDMERDNREVDSMWDHVLLAAVDTHPMSWFEGRVGYEHTWRRGDSYDFRAPFEDEAFPGQLPFLRKYDESEYDRDKLNVQLTFPTEMITPTCGYTLLFTDYDANFGVTEETRHAVNAGIDSDPWSRMHIGLNGNLEWYDGNQQSRQWSSFNPATPGAGNGIGDPYFTDTGDFSFSNWEANIYNRVVTFNADMVFQLVIDKLDLETRYTFMHAGEHVGFDSPIGDPAGATAQARDNNSRDESLFALSDGDNSTWNNARVQFRWKVRKNLTILFGYLFEKFDHEDYRWRGFDATPQNPTTGAYAGLLSLNRDPEDYESHAGFISLLWEF